MSDKDVNKDTYLTFSRLVSGLALALVIIMGWLFNIFVTSSSDLREDQEISKVRSAVNQVEIDCINRIIKLERERRNIRKLTDSTK